MASGKGLKEKAGVVAYRMVPGGDPLVLLVTSRKYKGSWVFPGGTVEAGESVEEAAQRECAEEAGYQVDLGMRLPAIEVSNRGTQLRFTFFLATVAGNAATWETDRRRGWYPASNVADMVPNAFRDVAYDAVQQLMQMKSK